MARCIAVLTGDIIDSRRIRGTAHLSRVLDDVLALLASRFGARVERYRGDGFQVALGEPEHAMNAAVLLRAALIRHSTREQRWDARIAIAIGPDEHWDETLRVGESAAPPFVASGSALDALGGERHLSLILSTASAEDGLALLIRFIDELIDGWSAASAEAIYFSLCHAESQQALAARLGISQPGVHKRLRTARWPLLQETLAYMQRRLKDEQNVS